MTRSARRTLLALPLLAGLATALPGCDGGDDAATALAEATTRIQALTPAGTGPASLGAREKTYREVVTTLQAVSGKGSASQKAAAAVLVSQAQQGLASIPAQRAVEAQRSVLLQLNALRGTLDAYLRHAGRAQAAPFDPAAELKALADQDAQRAAQAQQIEARIAELTAQLAALRDESRALAEQAKGRQNEAGVLRQRAVSETAVAAEALLKQAREIGRQGDALESQAAQVDARAEQLAPEIPAAQLDLERVRLQRELIAKAKTDVESRAQAAQKDAAEARADAAKSAEEVKRMVGQIEQALAGEWTTLIDEAAQTYAKAAAAAKPAVQEARTAAQLALGSAQQSLGDTLWNKAHALGSWAEALNALAGAKPALPDAPAYKTKSDEARAAAEAAATAAAEAYQAAKAAFAGSGSGGKTSEGTQARLDSLNSRLAEVTFRASGGKIDERPKPEQPEGQPPADEAPPADAAPQAAGPELPPLTGDPAKDVAAAIDHAGALAAAGRQAEVIANVIADDATKALMTKQAELAPKALALDAALRESLKVGLAEALGGVPGGGAFDPAVLSGRVNASMYEITVVDPSHVRARPTIVAGAPAVDFRLVDGRWREDLTALAPQMQMAAPLFDKLPAALDALTADAKAGTFKTTQQFSQAFARALAQAMGMPTPGGG